MTQAGGTQNVEFPGEQAGGSAGSRMAGRTQKQQVSALQAVQKRWQNRCRKRNQPRPRNSRMVSPECVENRQAGRQVAGRNGGIQAERQAETERTENPDPGRNAGTQKTARQAERTETVAGGTACTVAGGRRQRQVATTQNPSSMWHPENASRTVGTQAGSVPGIQVSRCSNL